MYELITQHIKHMVQADDTSLGYVLSHFEEVKTRRGQVLLREGEQCRYCYFINKGCVQVYTVNDKGDEATRAIFTDGQWFTNIESFSKESPSVEFSKPIESSSLLSISRDNFFGLIAKVPQFMEAYRQILELSYQHSVTRINSFNAMDAAARLQWLYKHEPELM